MQRYLLTLSTGLLTLTLTARAQISLDGTLGKSGALSGPNYQIGADLGQQHGGNLFHSFRDFNLQSHESATFSGPTNVQNIISRVTGGNPSSIDGTLRSTIPNADMYFLNPYGIMFGPNAKLDVQGSFHASTADYLRLQDGGRFEARVPGNSLLTVAPVAAFGFLTEAPGEIRLQDSKLEVPEGKTLSLIGGDLRLTGSHPYTDDGTELNFDAELTAPGGRINLASVASQGEVIPTDTDLSLNQVARRGTILARNELIYTSGNHGGSVFIRGGQFELTGSGVSSQTIGDQNGGSIDIQVDNLKLLQGSQISSSTFGTGNAGAVVIKAGTVEASGSHESGLGNSIASQSVKENSGNAGTVKITARQLTMADDAVISSITSGKGNAGNIEIESHQITLTDEAQIDNSTFGNGDGGDIVIKVDGVLIVSGRELENNVKTSGFFSISSTTTNINTDKVGNINIESGQMVLNNAVIVTDSLLRSGTITIKVSENMFSSNSLIMSRSGIIPTSTGESSVENTGQLGSKPGNIEIQAQRITLNSSAIVADTARGVSGGSILIKATDNLILQNHSKIDSNSAKVTTGKVAMGNAGHIKIEAGQMTVTDGSQIRSFTNGPGKGGDIVIEVADTLTISELDEKCSCPSGIWAVSDSQEPDAGDAGNVLVRTNTINLTGSGEITTGANNASGGNISILVPNLLYLQAGKISTSVAGGNGNGGNINIETPVFLVLDKAKILAQADEGKGGNITITANHRLSSKPESNNVIDATSKKNVSGKVVIKAQEEEVGGTLTILPATLKNYEIVKQRCTAEKIADRKKRSKFVKTGRGGVSDAPTQLRSGSVMDVMGEQLW